MNRSKFLFDF